MCRCVAAFLVMFLWLDALPVCAQTTPTLRENAVGTSCSKYGHATDFDTMAQCNNITGGTMQKAPLFVGTVTAPPYAATTCDASKAGMIQWTGTQFVGCDGTIWTVFGMGICEGPASISFTAQTDVAVNTAITSDANTMSNFACAAQVVCVGCIIVKNGSDVGTSTTTVSGDTIAIKQTSSTNYNTMTTAAAYVGTTSGTFAITTLDSVDPCDATTPTAGTVCNDGSIYAGFTPDGNVKMYTTTCDAGQSGAQSSCTGTRSTKTWSYTNTTTGFTNAVTGQANSAGIYALTASSGPYEAATYCEELDSNGHTDWYLPALGELNVLFANNAAIGGFDTGSTGYWSSREASLNGAYYETFSAGYQNSKDKTTSSLIRCVRR